MTPPDTADASIEEEIERSRGTNGGPQAETFEDADAEAAFWRAQYEQGRERLAKLWVAYRDVEAELELRKEEAEAIAQRKTAAALAEVETADVEADDEPEQPGVLAIAPPDAFEVVCEAQEREVPAGRGTSFGLVFANRGDEPVTAGLTVEDVPDGWSALPTETSIELDAHSSKTVYVLVRSPEDATPGRTVRVTVGVETPEGTAEPMELAAEVVEREEDGEQDAEPEAVEEEVDAVIGATPGEEPIDASAEDETSQEEIEEPAEETVEEDAPDGLEEDEIAEGDAASAEGDDDAA